MTDDQDLRGRRDRSTCSRWCRSSARTRSARRAASTPPSTPRAKATRPRSTSTTRIYGGDFLANQPPVQGHVRRRPGDHLPARSHGRDLQPHPRGAARLPPLRRHQASPHGLRRRHHRPAAALRARRAGAPLRGGRHGPQVRDLGVLYALVDDDGICRGIIALDQRTHGGPGIPGRRRGARDRRPGHRLRAQHQLDRQHRHRGGRRLPAGRLLRQRRVHPGASDGHSRRGQAAAHLRVGARRGRARVDRCATASRGTSSRRCTRPTATWCRATSRRAPSSRSSSRWGSASTARTLVYLDVTHIDPEELDAQARRRARDLREVHGRRSAQRADEGLPRPCTTRWAACGWTTTR